MHTVYQPHNCRLAWDSQMSRDHCPLVLFADPRTTSFLLYPSDLLAFLLHVLIFYPPSRATAVVFSLLKAARLLLRLLWQHSSAPEERSKTTATRLPSRCTASAQQHFIESPTSTILHELSDHPLKDKLGQRSLTLLTLELRKLRLGEEE